MPPSRDRCWWKSLQLRQSLFAAVFENVNIILNCILFCRAAWGEIRMKAAWFHDAVLQYWDDRQWIENFRMTRQTLFEITDVLRPYLMRRDTVMRSAIPVEERVAIGVYFLASRSCYRTIAHIFQKGTSTIASVMVEVCLAIEHTLLKEEVQVVDFNKKMEAGTLIPGNPMFQYRGVPSTTDFGGRAYPLCNWLMKPYAVLRNEMERHYNKVFNRTRNIVECAFGCLKARFRRLSVCMEAHIQNVNSIIASAVILHNICEKKKHFIPDEDKELQNTSTTAEVDVPDLEPTRGTRERMEAEAIRTAIADYLFTHVK
ncbi:hypothetical protein JRQ81_014530 [Phrynocephalus forsythii]|uniref:DDE Tnp4 domain-containing protein n=1 Tax=Phrynocephalus forsythii TaxID=171643 RepID=A0A9Q0XYT5_9SAUR|nr:hypothetical protein JRQ81_014530 [Phrynocephalus forsythii]